MRKLFVFGIFVLGASGMVAQIVLLRELVVIFSGNELSIGIILANWLLLEAAGAFAGGRLAEKTGKKIESFAAAQLVFAISFPSAVYCARILKNILGFMPGEALGVFPMAYSSFFILALPGMTHGALFTFACKIYSELSGGSSAGAFSAGKVYFYEMLGSIIGGLSLTYLCIPYFHSFQTAFGASVLNTGFCVALALPLLRPKPKTRSPHEARSAFILPTGTEERGHFGVHGSSVRRIETAGVLLACLSCAVFLAAVFIEFGAGADKIHRLSVARQWKGQDVIQYRNSVYGNIAVLKNGEQYAFISDGTPIATAPVPDIEFTEEYSHLTLLTHPDPQSVLVLGGGAGGLLKEILKHPVERVDYAELDPLLLRLFRAYSTPLTKSGLDDSRVSVAHEDGRFFVKTAARKYDVILTGFSEPSTLQINRLFTEEFFAEAKSRLASGGIFAVALPGSLTYLDENLLRLNACVLSTLKKVYAHVKIIPGDFNIFLASDSAGVVNAGSQELCRRFSARKIKADFVTAPQIAYRLAPEWSAFFNNSLASLKNQAGLNTDFTPRAVFYSLARWNAMFSPGTAKFLELAAKTTTPRIAVLTLIFTAVFLAVRIRKKALSGAVIPAAIAFTGFAGMIFNLALIFAFQSLYGYVYQWIGILSTCFMAGAAVGSYKMINYINGGDSRIRAAFVLMEAAIVLFAVLLLPAFTFLRAFFETGGGFHLLKWIFPGLCFVAGMLTGAQFPLAAGLQLIAHPRPGSAVGLIYGCDLMGGWLGGVAGGVILLPVMGLYNTCLLAGVLKLSSLAMTAFEYVREKQG